MSTCHGSEVVLTMCLPLSMLLSRDKRCKVVINMPEKQMEKLLEMLLCPPATRDVAVWICCQNWRSKVSLVLLIGASTAASARPAACRLVLLGHQVVLASPRSSSLVAAPSCRWRVRGCMLKVLQPPSSCSEPPTGPPHLSKMCHGRR